MNQQTNFAPIYDKQITSQTSERRPQVVQWTWRHDVERP